MTNKTREEILEEENLKINTIGNYSIPLKCNRCKKDRTNFVVYQDGSQSCFQCLINNILKEGKEIMLKEVIEIVKDIESRSLNDHEWVFKELESELKKLGEKHG